jgi:hypothetical protein
VALRGSLKSNKGNIHTQFSILNAHIGIYRLENRILNMAY